MSGSEICKILQSVFGFVVASAFAQLIAVLSHSQYAIALAAVIFYLKGHQNNSLTFQAVAVGLVFGWSKCFFVG
ncbi:hypothetical protein VF04_04150 [Nostoc linckia z7]|uniref:Uncharacterized protein n=2 Tax=Nostoc linckia TaxID=92942 RepID=A0A9Q6ENF8_NOSLI|nr:hypothetical protein [Nostoc linckia]PHK42905.1 hypothetical protein VF12_00850 [Nostoc linckia z15]PHK48062.1 hypothetical protein VF13_01825 [Nostoc linckia z16]PHJ64982.1 hypothetical protein VF02_11635 [Nostoc linckia z1]PHJ70160.1 hypothetical protein VF05_11795 [Nostoc linckia z3]PHJ75061.1 hypothetical protein VF03_11955 [Nostoc linckia z2]